MRRQGNLCYLSTTDTEKLAKGIFNLKKRKKKHRNKNNVVYFVLPRWLAYLLLESKHWK